MEQACRECYFYDAVEKDGGICRRNPPQPFIVPTGVPGIDGKMQIATQSFQPPVSTDAWCGEFVDQSEAEAAPGEGESTEAIVQ